MKREKVQDKVTSRNSIRNVHRKVFFFIFCLIFIYTNVLLNKTYRRITKEDELLRLPSPSSKLERWSSTHHDNKNSMKIEIASSSSSASLRTALPTNRMTKNQSHHHIDSSSFIINNNNKSLAGERIQKKTRNKAKKKKHSTIKQQELPPPTIVTQIKISNLKNISEHIEEIFNSAKITTINQEEASQLPTGGDITSMYGERPVIRGLETCEHYRKMVKPEDRTIGPAGLFNTGTNLIWKLMTRNCNIDGKILWQAPWGKHSPASNRLKRVASSGKGINQTEFFPFIMIKDPFSWMNSQCRHDYGVTFWNTLYDEKHCPNLIRGNVLDRDETAPVKLFKSGKTHDSLLDVYNYWYGEVEAERTKFPHLSIRYEDLLFHGKEVSRIACECVGGNVTTDFHFESESAKGISGGHKGSSGMTKALIQYGDPATRLNGFTDRDMRYARKNNATAKLMKEYGYSYPDSSFIINNNSKSLAGEKDTKK